MKFGDRPLVFVIAFITIASLLLFIATAIVVVSGRSDEIDRAFLLFFRNADDIADALGPGWFEEAAAEFTTLGGYTVLTVLVVIALGTLLILKKYGAALFLFLAVCGGSVLSTYAKVFFDRGRPDIVDHMDRTFTSSFPSAHAMVGALAWLTLAAVAIRFIENRLLAGFILGAAVAISLLVGLSRIYLGVHWPTDVIAGWFLGIAWSGGCWLTAHYLSGSPEQKADLGRSV